MSLTVDTVENLRSELTALKKQHLESLRSLQALLTGVDDIVFEITPECRFVEVWCRKPEKLFLPREAFIGKTFAECLPPQLSELSGRSVQQVLKTGRSARIEYPDPSNPNIWYSSRATAVPSEVEGQPPTRLVVVVSDITEEKRTAEALKKSEELFKEVTDLSPDIVSIVNSDGTLAFNSKAVERVHGYSVEELRGRNTFELMHPEDREPVEQALRDLLKEPGGLASVQYRYLHRSGRYTWMEAVGSNQVQNPLINGVITISRDISQRKQLEEKLRAAVASRDEFLSVASHDLKTPLTALNLQLELLCKLATRDSAEDRAQFETLSQLCLREGHRLAALLEDLMDLTRIRVGRLTLARKPTDLRAAVQSVVAAMSEEIARSGSTVEVVAPDPVVGQWDPSRLAQVITNLMSNAVKYGAGTRIEVRISSDAGRAELVVKDGGVGIAPELHELIFRPFERGVERQRISGLGLGLFIVREIIQAHGGEIRLESAPGKGSTFEVRLPLDFKQGS